MDCTANTSLLRRFDSLISSAQKLLETAHFKCTIMIRDNIGKQKKWRRAKGTQAGKEEQEI
jgi:hypothetical protein